VARATGRLTVDLGALCANYQQLVDAATPSGCGAVVKANGYGFGASQVASSLWEAGCRDYFVATVDEGIGLRETLVDARIFVFAGVDVLNAQIAADHRLVPVINHTAQLDAWRDFDQLPIAVHVDTGMNRLGFDAGEVRARDFVGFEVSLLMTHFACADEPDHPLNQRQLERFARASALFPGVPTSIGNSAGTLSGHAGDLGRPGIALCGGNPFVDRPNPMRAVATLEGEVLQLRHIKAGTSIGYGATFVAHGPRLIGVVGIGYADGLSRQHSNLGTAAVDGERVPIVGRVSMDLTMVDVTDVGAAVGDWVEFIGTTVTVDEVAEGSNTIAYEILTGLGKRAEHIYLGRS
jgi:alanine racemase